MLCISGWVLFARCPGYIQKRARDPEYTPIASQTETDRQAGRQAAGRQAGRQAVRPAGRQAGRQADRQRQRE